MRDKLIELLYEAEGQVNNDIPSVEQIADHLLANGVNVQSEGEWIFNRGRTYGEPAYYCSNCSEGSSEYGYDKYCPNCGAHMKGGE